MVDHSIDPIIDLNETCYDLIKEKDFPQKAQIFLMNLTDPK